MSRLEEIKDDLPLTIRKSPYLEELIEYVEELEEERDEWKDTAQSYYMTNQKLREQNKRYKQALEFYADKKTYDIGSVLRTPIGRDCGETARQALEGKK